MALGVGKLTLLIGAGILGSVYAKESQVPSISELISGSYKLVRWPFQKTDSTSPATASHPKNDALIAQVNNLRYELQMLASSSPVTIVTSRAGAGGRRYGTIVLVVVVGYGYVWWKGWKLPDLTFATRRSLSDACNSIAKQLEQVYSSIRTTRRDLSSRLDRTDSSLNDLSKEQDATKEEVSLLHGEVESFDVNIQTVRQVVETLESRIHRMQGREDNLNSKVTRLVGIAQNLDRKRSAPEAIQGSSNASRPALEPPQISPCRRTGSLPPASPALTLEDLSPSTSDASNNEAQQKTPRSPSASGLKDIEGMSLSTKVPASPRISNGTHNSEGANGSARNGGVINRFTPGALLSRTKSVVVQGFKQ